MSNPVETHGMFSWFELMTDDVQGAKKFYKALLGWQLETDRNNPDYTLVRINESDFPIAGIMDKNIAMGEKAASVPSHWGNYITVDDLNDILEKVGHLGGKVIVPATPIPKVGTFGVIQDPQGAVISLMQYQIEAL